MSNIHSEVKKQELIKEIDFLIERRNSLLVKNKTLEHAMEAKKRLREELDEEIKTLREGRLKEKEDFERQKNHINRELKKIEKVVDYRNELLNRVGILNFEDNALDKREESQRRREKMIEVKDLEIKNELKVLEEKKKKALLVREAQSSSYYRPTEDEEEFFLEKRGDFLAEYEKTGNIAKAASKIGIRPSLISYYKKKYPEFTSDMMIAYDVFKDYLDGEIIDRGINGQLKPSFFRGEVVEYYTEKSDKLIEVAAKAHIPEKYDRSKLDRIDGAKQTNVVVNMVSFKDVKVEDFGAIEQVGVVSFVGEHGEMKRITNDKMSQHEEAIDPSEVIIDVDVEKNQSKSVVFKEEDND